MKTKPFVPVVLAKHKVNGAAVMWTRRLWESTKHPNSELIASADTPEEKAKLWELKDKLNHARKTD